MTLAVRVGVTEAVLLGVGVCVGDVDGVRVGVTLGVGVRVADNVREGVVLYGFAQATELC